MKKLIALLFLFSPSVALADITQKFTTSAQISVDMPYSVTNKLGTTYSISGNNITPSVTSGGSTTSGAIGGINIGSLTAGVPAMIQHHRLLPHQQGLLHCLIYLDKQL